MPLTSHSSQPAKGVVKLKNQSISVTDFNKMFQQGVE